MDNTHIGNMFCLLTSELVDKGHIEAAGLTEKALNSFREDVFAKLPKPTEEEVALASSDHTKDFIKAIKAYRSRIECGLREAKDIMEQFRPYRRT